MNPQGFRWIALSTRLAIYARDGWRCLCCHRALRWKKGHGSKSARTTDIRPGAASLDHVIPKSQGGTNAPENLITLCVRCNSCRSDEPLETWQPRLVDLAAIAVSTPIDRALGRALADELDPGYARRNRRACKAWRERRAAAPF